MKKIIFLAVITMGLCGSSMGMFSKDRRYIGDFDHPNNMQVHASAELDQDMKELALKAMTDEQVFIDLAQLVYGIIIDQEKQKIWGDSAAYSVALAKEFFNNVRLKYYQPETDIVAKADLAERAYVVYFILSCSDNNNAANDVKNMVEKWLLETIANKDDGKKAVVREHFPKIYLLLEKIPNKNILDSFLNYLIKSKIKIRAK